MIECPNCGCTESRVLFARSQGKHLKRKRSCKGCATTYDTLETLAVYAGRHRGMVLDMNDRLQHELVNQPPMEVNG